MSSDDEQVSGTRGKAEDTADFHPLDRFNAFSDGVFAIVITLLVLELPVPPEGVPVLPALAKSWPEFLGYAVSFAFVGGIWLSHAGLTKYLKRGDAISFRLNLVLLLFVSLLPFSTHLMVLHMEGDGAREAVAVYGVNLFLASGMMTALMYYAAHDRYLVVDDLADDKLRRAYHRRRAYLIPQCFGHHRGSGCFGDRAGPVHCPDLRIHLAAVTGHAAQTLTLKDETWCLSAPR